MLTIPYDRLPTDRIARNQTLERYFSDRLVSCNLVNGNWNLSLSWPDDIGYYVDPNLQSGLHWWGQNATVEDIPLAVSRKEKYQLSLNDTWSLFSWSHWLRKKMLNSLLPDELIIIHIDDHDDLMSPRLVLRDEIWTDIITEHRVYITDPTSVSDAIMSGAIGIGSYILPFIHQIPKVDIRHLIAPNSDQDYNYSRKKITNIEVSWVDDSLLALEEKRIKAHFRSSNEPGLIGSQTYKYKKYKVSDNPKVCFDELPDDVPVLLHIDMDFFNNRFNGDSDWQTNDQRYDPSLEEILLSIDELFDEFISHNLFNRIEDITIALSPGFFPAELWEPSIKRISSYIDKYL